MDIDGVIQPYNSNIRFKHIKDTSLLDILEQRTKINYRKYDIYDVYATYYDWNKNALNRLKYILEVTNSKIIISSDWRNSNMPSKIHDLLKIHNLDNYWFTDNIIESEILSSSERRAKEIEISLNRYPIDNYVILDDMKPLYKYYQDNFVLTDNYISEDKPMFL